MRGGEQRRLTSRVILAVLGGLALSGALTQPAFAGRQPIPTAEQVAAAHDAQQGVAAQVQTLDVQLTAARQAVADAQSAAADADMARHSAEAQLERATGAAVLERSVQWLDRRRSPHVIESLK